MPGMVTKACTDRANMLVSETCRGMTAHKQKLRQTIVHKDYLCVSAHSKRVVASGARAPAYTSCKPHAAAVQKSLTSCMQGLAPPGA